MHGLLQTPDYAAAIARSVGVIPEGENYVEQKVALRRLRQRRVYDGELSLVVVQSEFSLRLQMGDAAVMATQLSHLAQMCSRPNVSVLITPYEVGQYEALRMGSFTIFSGSAKSGPVVHREDYDGGQLINGNDKVEPFIEAFDHARKLALSSQESQDFITHMHKEWKRNKQ